MKLTRRAVFGGGLALTAVWVAGQGYGHRPLPARSSPFLGTSGRATLEAAFEVLLPEAADPAGLAAAVDHALAEGDPALGAGLLLALRLLEHAGGAGPLQFRRFSRRSLGERRAVLDRWRTSGWAVRRQVFAAVRSVALFAWYGSPEAWPAIGYPGPLVGR